MVSVFLFSGTLAFHLVALYVYVFPSCIFGKIDAYAVVTGCSASRGHRFFSHAVLSTISLLWFLPEEIETLDWDGTVPCVCRSGYWFIVSFGQKRVFPSLIIGFIC